MDFDQEAVPQDATKNLRRIGAGFLKQEAGKHASIFPQPYLLFEFEVSRQG